ncbi:sensor histidine kinase [Actinoplanes sp. NPDC051859]|uniref:sensor histidine kinase n=1 Tax=Actinoplanes sp. NPDC051859 TaxID=3363909 RepID=UPI0037B9A5BA
MTGWWRRRGKAQRVDLFIRVNLYAIFALLPVFVGLLVAPEPQVDRLGVAALVALTTTHAAGCVLLLRAALDYYGGSGPRPVRGIAVGAALTAAGVAAVVITYPEPPPGALDGPASLLTLVLSTAFLAALAPAVPLGVTFGAVVGAGGLRFAVQKIEGAEPTTATTVALASAALYGAVAAAFRMSAWITRLVAELERARQVEARLAVAEERLRFARDMHDIVGRALSVVALKSELAARLAQRGRAEAAAEMLEVRRIAEESLADVRAVVRGYRQADLGTELAGARSLLAAAGIDCRVDGASGGLPDDTQGALGWVVREATTNVLRHSEARTCTVTLRRTGDRIALIMENDGVPPPAPTDRVRFGSGLIGLAERIAGVGGTTAAERGDPGLFRLTVEVPVGEGEP